MNGNNLRPVKKKKKKGKWKRSTGVEPPCASAGLPSKLLIPQCRHMRVSAQLRSSTLFLKGSLHYTYSPFFILLLFVSLFCFSFPTGKWDRWWFFGNGETTSRDRKASNIVVTEAFLVKELLIRERIREEDEEEKGGQSRLKTLISFLTSVFLFTEQFNKLGNHRLS